MPENHLTRNGVILITDPTTRPTTHWRVTRPPGRAGVSPRIPPENVEHYPTIELAVLTDDGDFARIAVFPLALAADIADAMYRLAHDPRPAPDRMPSDHGNSDG